MHVLMRFKDDLKDLVQRLMDVAGTIRRRDRLLPTESFETLAANPRRKLLSPVTPLQACVIK
jgi:hypothetical protein